MSQYALSIPARSCRLTIEARHFQGCDLVTFRYRELTDDKSRKKLVFIESGMSNEHW